MRKSMKQRVALFLVAAMAFTSVDSSALVAAADVTGEEMLEVTALEETMPVEEEQQEEELAEELTEDPSGESADAVLEDAEEYSEDASVYSTEELQDEGEQLIGEESIQTYAEDDSTVVSDEETADITVTFDRDDDRYLTAEYGTSVVLNASASASDGSELAYQWQIWKQQGDDGVWENIEGATAEEYQLSASRNAIYNCNVTDQNKAIYRKEFYVTVQTLSIGLDTWQYLKVPQGQKYVLNVGEVNSYLGTDITYKWYEETEPDQILGTESTLTITPENHKSYRCDISDGNYRDYLIFDVSVDVGITIGENEEFGTVQPDTVITMQMVKENPDNVPLTYKWYRYNYDSHKDELIEGATDNSYSITAGKHMGSYTCYATDNYGNIYKKHFFYNIDSLTIDNEKTQCDVKVPLNENVVLEVVASTIREEDIKYSWEKYDPENENADENGYVTLEGENKSTLEVKNVTKPEKYWCILNDGNNSPSVDFTVSVDVGVVVGGNQYFGEKEPGETITMQLADEIPEGVILNFKWYRYNRETWDYDIAIEGAKENTYSVTVENCSGNYKCEATDQYGNTYTRCFEYYVPTLTINWEEMQTEVVVPVNGSVELKMSAETTQAEGIQYSWEKYDPENGDPASGYWKPLEGETNDTLKVEGVTRQEKYRCTLDDGNERISDEFTVLVDIGFEFIDNPTYMTGEIGDQVVLDAEATVKEGSLSYQWYRYEDEDGYVLIPDAVTSQYTATVEEGKVEYQCVVTDIYDGVHVRYMYVRPDHSITIENSYNEQSVKPEEKVTMSVNASTKAGPLSYQWQVRNNAYEWEDISDATDASYTVEIVDNLYYRCVVSNGYEGENQAAEWHFSIESGLEIGKIDDRFNVEIGQDVTLTMNATTEYGKLTYEWQRTNEDINAGSIETIEGATDSTYTVENVQKSGIYYCIVSNGYDSFEQSYHIHVNSGLEVSTENEEVYVRKGETATLNVNATSNYPITYKWYTEESTDDEDIYVKLGNETNICVTSPVTGYKSYVCVISDGYNTKRCDFSVDVDKGFRASAEQAEVWVPKGSEAELKVNASIYEEYGPLTYQWYSYNENHDTESIEGATASTYIVKNVTKLQKYFCRVKNGREDSLEVDFCVGPENEKDNYALDFSTAKVMKENTENLAVIPVEGMGVYFKFVPNRTGIWEIYSQTDCDTKVYLYDANKNEIAYNDDGFDNEEENYNFCLSEVLEQGKTYYFKCCYLSDDIGSYPVFIRYIGNGEEDHIWDEGTITQQPTCETAGVKAYVCMNCGETRTAEIAATGHAYPEGWTVRKTATCTENGVQYRVCNNCGKEETEEIAVTGHSYGEVKTQNATSTENGKRYQICSVCKNEKILEVIPTTVVAEKVEAVKDTVGKLDGETATGSDLSDAISAIKDMDNQTMIDMDAAEDESAKTNLNELVKTVEDKLLASKDLTDAGIQGVIGETVISDGEEVVSGAAATGAAVTVASVVKEAGFNQEKDAKYQAQIQVKENKDSSVENGVYKVDISMNILKTVGEKTTTAKSDVQPAAPVKITMPIPVQFQNARFTLEHNGKAVAYTLNEDGKSISFYAPSFSPWEMKIQKCAEGKHNYVEAKEDSAWKEATHTEGGMKVEVCSICNDRKETTIPKMDHKWGDWKVTKEASCKENGTKERTCDLCSQTETADILKTGHSMGWIVDQEATCAAAGSQHQECTICHIKGAEAEIPATANHNMQLVAAKEATCTEAGSKAYWICNTCKKVYADADAIQETTEGAQVIPAKGHKWETKVDRAATCGATGSQHSECSVCHTKEAATTIPATGKHNMQIIVDKTATCGATGSQHSECSVCHTKEAATTIPATGKHSFGEYVVTKEATALAAGTETRTCKTCSTTESRSIAQLIATIKLTETKVMVKAGDSTEVGKYVTGLAKGDSVEGYTSSNNKTVIVSSTGKVTGKAAGTAVITVKLASGKTADITVTVKKKEIATKSIKNLSKTMKMKVKGTAKLKPVISPSDTTDKLTYTSSNKKVVTVSAKGKMTAKKAGKAKITVKSGKKKFTITVTVVAPTPTGMKNVPKSKKMAKGKSFVLKPTILPAGAKGKITYKTSNKKVATVDAKGKVTAKKKGSAVITVTIGKIKKTCKVTVK